MGLISHKKIVDNNIDDENEKINIKIKIKWEGGLKGYISYGVDEKLYYKFQNEFDEVYKFVDDCFWTKRQRIIFKNLENSIDDYLNEY